MISPCAIIYGSIVMALKYFGFFPKESQVISVSEKIKTILPANRSTEASDKLDSIYCKAQTLMASITIP